MAWPSRYLEVLWITISAPKAKGRQLTGVGKVLSTINGTPWAWARAGVLPDIQHIQRRVGKGFPKQQLGFRAEGRLDFLIRGIRLQEGHVDPHFPQGLIEQIEGAPVNGAAADDVVAAVSDVQHRDPREAAWPAEVSSAPTPPSRAAILFSTALVVGLDKRV